MPMKSVIITRPETALVKILMGLDSALRGGVETAGAGASVAFISDADEAHRRIEPADLSAEWLGPADDCLLRRPVVLSVSVIVVHVPVVVCCYLLTKL